MGSEKPVKLFVMGKNAWREEDDWPLARAHDTRYYLHSSGKANTLSGDGTLATPAPATEPADKYVYDPADPAPTRGGPLCCDGDSRASGRFRPAARGEPRRTCWSTPRPLSSRTRK